MFGTGQSGLLFGAAPMQNNATSFFSSNTTQSTGTTYPYQAFDSTDTLQKNNTTVTLNTKLHCLTAMKVYELKSIEELRWEDYQSNRLTKTGGSMFIGNQQIGTHAPMFTSSYSPYTPNQPTQSTLFTNTNQQNNTFGNKSPFATNNSVTTPAFGTFNNQSKPNSLFSSTSSPANKPIFGAQSTGMFGAPTSTTGTSLFGSQQQPAQPNTSFFGGTQSSNIFTNPTSSLGFQSQPNATLFSGTAAKPFGNSTGFAATSTPSVFGNPTSTTGSLFGQQNVTATPFGATSKASLFPGTNAFSSQASTNQSGGLFTQPAVSTMGTSAIFGNTQKPATPGSFGTSLFGTSTPKVGLFGNVTQNTSFGVQQPNAFGNFSSQQFNPQTVTTSTVVPTIGYNNPAEALLQQQLTQQKILSLVSNRPYGVKKLFMGQNLSTTEKVTLLSDTVTNNTNIMSLAIKRNDTDKYGMFQRKKILSERTKVNPNNLHKVFSGFDVEDDLSLKSNSIEKNFFTKREDWKYLPPDAFEKSRKSIISNRSLNGSVTINSNNSLNNDNRFTEVILSPLTNANHSLRDNDNNKHSTPISNNGNYKQDFQNDIFSPIHFNNTLPCLNTKDEIEECTLGTSSFLDCDYTNIRGITKDDEVVVKEQSDEKLCDIKLTKEGYYMAPSRDVLDKLVSINEYGEYECLVENFIVGRKLYGSIRFPGLTNVYGLDLDELVDFRHKEVSVYPDDEMKPDIGEGINKQAQVILHQIFPIDKTNGETIKNIERLKAMHFEDKLKRVTEKLGAKFISFTANRGVWVFEVEHFSKYRYSDDDDEENKNLPTDNKNKEEQQIRTQEIKSTIVISAEADSMTSFLEETQQRQMNSNNGLQRFYDKNKNKCIQRMKQNLYRDDNDEEENTNNILSSQSLIKEDRYNQKEEPSSKRFQSVNIGMSILDSSLNNSMFDADKQYLLGVDSNIKDCSVLEDCRPIKEIKVEPIASTTKIISDSRIKQRLEIPYQFRDVKNLKMPYLPLKFNIYFELSLSDIHNKYSFDAGLSYGNRYRVGFHTSSIGLKYFIKDYSNHCDESLTSLGIRHDNIVLNAINVMKFEYTFSEYQEKLLNSALYESECCFNNDEECPLWKPHIGLTVLNSYVNTNFEEIKHDSFEISVFDRTVSLCKALWADIADNNTKLPVKCMDELERKQYLSKWIRMESRNALMQKVKFILETSTKIDVDKCNDVILESLCCGEIQLACRLATLTKQHRMALLISQSAGSLQGRYIVREQLNRWSLDRSDEKIPTNVMCIYVLLSGQTSAAISDGSFVTPLKRLKWYQVLGCYQWFIQPYMDSIKSCLDLYSEDFKSDFDIPPPFPFNYSSNQDEDYPYYDCCYHLLNLYCDSFYDIDTILNPPSISESNVHKLSIDWSPSWHLSNILASFGNYNINTDKLCNEWAAQLERGGQWHWAVFIIAHITNGLSRKSLLRNLIIRNVTGLKILSEKEVFVIEKLRISEKWIHEAKAIYCKNIHDPELEAHHWFMFGNYDKSHTIYIEEILPKLLLNDKLDKMTNILSQFADIGIDKVLPSWSYGGGIYLQYLFIKRAIKAMKIANKLINHSMLMDEQWSGDILDEEEDFKMEIEKIKIKIFKLMNVISDYNTDSDVKIICKQQINSLCRTFLMSCSNCNINL